MTNSIISNERECLICKTPQDLHKHHFFPGTDNRKISERHGAWGYFCAPHHNISAYSIHMNRVLRLEWQRKVQRELMEQNGWTEDDFRTEFGKSFL